MTDPKCQIVIDLGFGDSGKGIVVDTLLHREEVELADQLVVRFSGGPQSGHHVKLNDDKQHTHSSFASGTLRGAASFFSRHTCISLHHLYTELGVLNAKGVTPNAMVDPRASLITPYDIIYGLLRDGVQQDGTCGLGVGATMHRQLKTQWKLFIGDVLHPAILRHKVTGIEEYYKGLAEAQGFEWDRAVEDYGYCIDDFLAACDQCPEKPIHIMSWQEVLTEHEYKHIVFEGSQGILLDQEHGTIPNVTYAYTTSRNAVELMDEMGLVDAEVWHVTRSYQTRHGNGPMTGPNWTQQHCEETLINMNDEINLPNVHQGALRMGPWDGKALEFALAADLGYHRRGIKLHALVVTCCDRLPSFSPEAMDFCFNYETKFRNSSAITAAAFEAF